MRMRKAKDVSRILGSREPVDSASQPVEAHVQFTCSVPVQNLLYFLALARLY